MVNKDVYVQSSTSKVLFVVTINGLLKLLTFCIKCTISNAFHLNTFYFKTNVHLRTYLLLVIAIPGLDSQSRNPGLRNL